MAMNRGLSLPSEIINTSKIINNRRGAIVKNKFGSKRYKRIRFVAKGDGFAAYIYGLCVFMGFSGNFSYVAAAVDAENSKNGFLCDIAILDKTEVFLRIDSDKRMFVDSIYGETFLCRLSNRHINKAKRFLRKLKRERFGWYKKNEKKQRN